MAVKTGSIIKYLFLLLVFLAGIYVCLTNGILVNNEGFDNQDAGNVSPQGSLCPDLLVKRNNRLLLYNSSQPLVDGSNPIVFDGLDDYIRYVDEQRRKGLHCPVLYLQQENNAQGEDVYRMRPSPFYVEGGLPPLPMEVHDNTIVTPIVDASRQDKNYNANSYPGFDPTSQYVGIYTNIDKIHDSTKNDGSGPMSDNPMDPNWGGVGKTWDSVMNGKYVGNEVTKPLYPALGPK